MKTKIIAVLLISIMMGSCATPTFLPDYSDIDVHPFGSYISIRFINGAEVNGELISIDKKSLIIRTFHDMNDMIVTTKCEVVLLSDIHNFILTYANPIYYSWSIPAYAVAAFTNGWAAIITLPVGLLVTTTVTSTGDNTFSYYDTNLPISQIAKFARFPNGLPESVTINQIK